MRAFALSTILAATVAPLAFANPVPNLADADRIEIWDQRIQDIHSEPKVVTDPRIVASVVRIVQGYGGGWRSGSLTSPSGYLRFVFIRASRTIAGIGLGERFLVFSTPDGWYSKEITAESEMSLNRINDNAAARQTGANQSPDPMPAAVTTPAGQESRHA